jgi:hypothetical protein
MTFIQQAYTCHLSLQDLTWTVSTRLAHKDTHEHTWRDPKWSYPEECIPNNVEICVWEIMLEYVPGYGFSLAYQCIYGFILVLLYVYSYVCLPWLKFLPCFFLSCKANAEIKRAKTGHGPHSSKFLCCSMYCLFLCRSVYCLCVNVYCTTATEWLQNCSL